MEGTDQASRGLEEEPISTTRTRASSAASEKTGPQLELETDTALRSGHGRKRSLTGPSLGRYPAPVLAAEHGTIGQGRSKGSPIVAERSPRISSAPGTPKSTRSRASSGTSERGTRVVGVSFKDVPFPVGRSRATSGASNRSGLAPSTASPRMRAYSGASDRPRVPWLLFDPGTGGNRSRASSGASEQGPLGPAPGRNRGNSGASDQGPMGPMGPAVTSRSRAASGASDQGPMGPSANRNRGLSGASDQGPMGPSARSRGYSGASDRGPFGPQAGRYRAQSGASDIDPFGQPVKSSAGPRRPSVIPEDGVRTPTWVPEKLTFPTHLNVPSAAPPRRASVITNIVIPPHLLNLVNTSAGWEADGEKRKRNESSVRTDTRDKFDIQTLANEQSAEVRKALGSRSASVSIGAPGRTSSDSDAPNRGPRRKTSLAASHGSSLNSQDSGMLGPRGPPPSSNGLNPNLRKISEANEDVESVFGGFGFGPSSRENSTAGLETPDPSSTAPRQSNDLEQPESSGWRWGGNSGDPFVRRGTIAGGPRRGSVLQRSASVIQETMHVVKQKVEKVRRGSMFDVYERAKVRGEELQRSKFGMKAFEYTYYAILVAIVYFVFIGYPLWNGTCWWLYYVVKHKFVVKGTWSVIIAVATLYAYTPLLVLFEKDPPMPEDLDNIDATKTRGVGDTCLMIPCYKSANLIGATLEAALKIFPPSHIYVIANGNSPTPLDNTEEVCDKYGVTHIWSPVGSKIVAQFVGCYAAKEFKNVLLIDDDCALPPNFPIVSDRMVGKVQLYGYTIKSVGPESSRGTLAQQAQDLEYKISGIQRALAGNIGSATFPHGAIALWDRDLLIKTFFQHPGFSVSEDWFFGHVARQLGARTKMCTSVFIETETPNAVFMSSGGARGGFGEMTIFKQRFMRWNFFFVNGMYYNAAYILFDWNLGWWELGAKLFVFQEIYETLLYLTTPFILPISFVVRPAFSTYLFVATFFIYFLNVVIFNEVHLRLKKERVPSLCVYVYYMPYKIVLTFVNVASCYYSLWKYAQYFSKRHPKVIEDDKAVGVVLQFEEEVPDEVEEGEAQEQQQVHPHRRMTITAIGAQTEINAAPMVAEEDGAFVGPGRRMTITTLGPRLDGTEPATPQPQQVNRRGSVDPRATVSIGGRKFSISSDEAGVRRMSAAAGPSLPVTRRASVDVVPGAAMGGQQAKRSAFKPSFGVDISEDVEPPEEPRRRRSSVSRHLARLTGSRGAASSSSLAAATFNSGIFVSEAGPARGGRKGSASGGAYALRAQPPRWPRDNEPVPDEFGDLMDKLAAIEDRLAAKKLAVVDFAIEEEVDEEVPAEAIGPEVVITMPDILEEEEEEELTTEEEMLDEEEEDKGLGVFGVGDRKGSSASGDSRKTDESKSPV